MVSEGIRTGLLCFPCSRFLASTTVHILPRPALYRFFSDRRYFFQDERNFTPLEGAQVLNQKQAAAIVDAAILEYDLHRQDTAIQTVTQH